MKKIWSFLSSWWLTCGLLAALLSMIFVEIRMTAHWRRFWTAAEKTYIGREEANALANAIEQYCVDFSEHGPLANDREWMDQLTGHNAKGIQYLKAERFSIDHEGRFLDPCGQPWIIEVPGSPGYETMTMPEPPDEFHVRSAACGGFAFGHSRSPKYSRS